MSSGSIRKNAALFTLKTAALICISIFFMYIPAIARAAAKSSVNMSVQKGQEFILPVNNTIKEKFTFKSSDENVAYASRKGIVTARKPGTAIITAKSKSGTVRVHLDVEDKELSQQDIKTILLSYREQYKNKEAFSDSTYYKWRAGFFNGGYGCAAFAFYMSDIIYGKKQIAKAIINPANPPEQYGGLAVNNERKKYGILTEDLEAGDIIGFNYGKDSEEGHAVIVLDCKEECVLVAEVVENKVYWNSVVPRLTIQEQGSFVLVRR